MSLKLVAAVIFGTLVGAGAISALQGTPSSTDETEASAEKKPLYWVAPMDSNYRRDKPGKSPMGMDLIPVYEEDASGTNDWGPGAITIAPHVVNNLGVRTSEVQLKTMHSEIKTVGYVQYDEDQLVHIHPRVDGWIEKLFVKAAGNPVEKGQPLYTLYSPQLVNAQEELLIALNRNNKSLIAAATERLRALQLSEKFIDELESSRKVKQNITFYSPQSGVVDGLKIREGFFVKPGNTLMSIGKLDQVWVEAEVFERDTAVIKEGLAVLMNLDYLPGKTWDGVVDYVYPTLNSKTRTLRVRLKFDNPEHHLKPNMFAQITIFADQDKEVIVVPKEAVIRTGSQDRVVLALGEGQFKSIEVTVGRVSQESIEILDGLTPDDVVVTSAQFLIDSESSKTSDFKRMTHDEEPQQLSEPANAATVNGTINSIDLANRILNISRGPIAKWNRPAVTMDFVVADDVDLSGFVVGDEVRFTFEVGDDFVITNISLKDDSPEEHVDHSNHE
ncbi:efflux RND transporter periplasmic adaptor subunit [Psychrosphaera ytuae]|uniref:Efflux RND transporter periplasmic adaptor subunit n=2 Tax=Psychrosphaera ytuae TaxID=2820710 RepID=A0A975DDP9_9GAMM|nr:efflux RND transporter periplasmic adaptor subunit [Psychrosphaera ytuae]